MPCVCGALIGLRRDIAPTQTSCTSPCILVGRVIPLARYSPCMAAVEEAGRKADRQEGQQKEKCMEKRMLASGFRVFFVDFLSFLIPKSIERGSRGPSGTRLARRHKKTRNRCLDLRWFWSHFGTPKPSRGTAIFVCLLLKPPLGDFLFIWIANVSQK